MSVHAALDELHVVLGQGPRLVRKHVLHLRGERRLHQLLLQRLSVNSKNVHGYLSQLLVQVRRVDHGPLAQLLVEHLVVPHDEVGAQELLHLHRDVHGDGDDVVEKDHEGQEVRERPNHLRNQM